MSRFGDCEDDGEGPSPVLWQQTVANALRGRRGQAVLRELREALLGLPQPRLIVGALVREGEVCALGALAGRRLAAGPLTLKGCGDETRIATSLAELEAMVGQEAQDEFSIMEFGRQMGLTGALSWAVAFENDEGSWNRETPEQTFRRVLYWVDRQLEATTSR